MTVKRVELLQQNRWNATSDPFLVYGFYNLLEEQMTVLNLQKKPDYIWNLDETYLCFDPSQTRGVVSKGQKAHRNIQGRRKQNITILATCSASGRCLALLTIYQGQNLWSTWKGKKIYQKPCTHAHPRIDDQ